MKKITTSERLKQIMLERDLKQVDILNLCAPFCKKYSVKLGKNDLSQYVSGKVTPGQDKLTILGMALNVDEVWLMGYDVPSSRQADHSADSGNMVSSGLSSEAIQIGLAYDKADEGTKSSVAKLLDVKRDANTKVLGA